MDAAGELAELGERGLRLGRGLVEAQLRRRIEVVAEARARQAKGQSQGDEPLLGAVVEVAFDPLSLGVPGGDDPRPRRLDLVELGLDLGLESGVVGGERLETLRPTRASAPAPGRARKRTDAGRGSPDPGPRPPPAGSPEPTNPGRSIRGPGARGRRRRGAG